VQNFSGAGLLKDRTRAAAWRALPGHRAIVSGSCSAATRAQVAHFISAGGAAYALDPLKLAGGDEVRRALDWARTELAARPVIVYSTADPAAVSAVQAKLGAAEAGALVERALAAIARGLIAAGVTQLVVAGGEISGAVVQALGIEALEIGPEIDPGVPWTATLGRERVLLALKSGNFGAPDFFTKAFAVLRRTGKA
jgi:uncharacterized protein YgbK (DUF1537 family)